MIKVLSKLKKNPLYVTLSIIIFLFVLFVPSKNITIDENNYIGNGYAILNNQLKQDCSLNLPGFFPVFDSGSSVQYCIYKYNIGTSVLLLPGIIIGGSAILLTSTLFYLGTIIVFSRILKLLKLSKNFIYIYAFFPALLYLSRTSLSEIFSLFFINLSILFALRYKDKPKHKELFFLGAFTGASVIIRYSNIVPLGLFIILLVFSYRFEIKKIIKMILPIFLGALPFIIFFLLFNNYLYLSPLRSGYSFSGEEIFNLGNIIKNLPTYFIALNIAYPAMLLVGFIKKNYLRFSLPAFSLILFYSASVNNLFEGRVLDLVVGIRFMVPILTFLLIPYFQIIQEKYNSSKLVQNIINFLKYPIIVIICIIAFANVVVHQKFLNETESQWPSFYLKNN